MVLMNETEIHVVTNNLSLGPGLIVSRKHETLELLHYQTSTLINPALIWNCTEISNAMKDTSQKCSTPHQALKKVTEKYMNRAGIWMA